MISVWRYISDLARPCANDGEPQNNAGSEYEGDDTDGVGSSCDAEDGLGPAEDSTGDPGAQATDPGGRGGARSKLQRQPSRMKICFDVGTSCVRMQRMQRSRKRSTFGESINHVLRSLTGTESSLSTEEPGEPTGYLAEQSFWRGKNKDLPPRLAEIAFDSGTTHYCVVSHQADVARLCERVMLHEWGLANPKLILSIMGGAGLMQLDRDRFDIDSFSKGLVEAALRTGAWVTTGGTKSGVMDIVGKAMKKHDKRRLVPCIGITPLGGLKAALRSVLLSGGPGRPKVDAAIAALEEGSELDRKLAEIQENHTHSIVCDSGDVGFAAFGKEVSLRAELEDYLGSRCMASRPASPVRSPTRRAVQGTQVPRVMILVNGGKITLTSALTFIRTRCPVVVCRGTGRVADLIGSLTEARAEQGAGFDFDEEYDNAVDEHMRSEMQSLTDADRESTRQIIESGWVEVYTISKRLEDVVLRAVLGSPSAGTQRRAVGVQKQLMLAVQWGCTDYFDTLGKQLAQECGGERSGPAKAISIIFQELTGVWKSCGTESRQSEMPESSGALVAWLLKNHLKQMDAFEITEETLGRIDWHRLGGSQISRSLEGLLLWCIEQDAPASVLETIWMYMEDPAHAGLVAASACRERGVSRFGSASYSDTVARANLDSIADRFERLAVLLLEELATTGKGIEYLFQESHRYNSYNCFRLAHHLGCKKFVSATFYRLAVDHYWRTPLPFSFREPQLGVEYLKPWNLLRLLFNPWEGNVPVGQLMSIPYIKCCTHGISRCTFIALYSHAVFYGLTYRRGFSVVEVLLFLWGLGFGMVEVNQYRQKGSASAYFSDFWNVLDALVIVSLLVALLLGWSLPDSYDETARFLEVIHALNLLPTWIRVGQVLQLDQELGTLFLTMGGMCKDALRFLVLVSIVCLGFSCALTPMLFKGEERESQGLLWTFWTIVGSIDEKALAKIRVDGGEATGKLSDGPGPSPGPLTHVLFYTLLLVANVLLVNLLIAVMNSTYERNMENSQTEWAFYRVQTVLEFDEWADLPPPLNLLQLLSWPRSRSPSEGEPQGGWTQCRKELTVNKRDLKDSQQKAIATVGLEEDAGEISVLRADNAELRRRNAELLRRREELEGLAANFLIENSGLPSRPAPAPATPSSAGEAFTGRRRQTEPLLQRQVTAPEPLLLRQSTASDSCSASVVSLGPFPVRAPRSTQEFSPPAARPRPTTPLHAVRRPAGLGQAACFTQLRVWLDCCCKRSD